MQENSSKKEVGTVISTFVSPSVGEFSFVVQAGGIPVRKNQFVQVETEEGTLIAMVMDVKKTNRYFARAESVREYERGGVEMNSIFPSTRWEYLIADAKPYGVYKEGVRRVSFPPSPGSKVYVTTSDNLKKFLQLDEKGLLIGSLEYHEVPIHLNLAKLFQKHLAILAMSGAGKSYTVSVLIEELLDRKKEDGRVAVIVIDPHGEYTSLAKDEKYKDRVEIVHGRDVKIGFSDISSGYIKNFLPNISEVQLRDLNKIFMHMKAEKRPFDVEDIIGEISRTKEMKENTKLALIGWLYELQNLNIFGRESYPNLIKKMKQGSVLIIDLSEIVSIQKKQMIVDFISRTLFNQRCGDGLIPPYVEIIEEAHQFVPQYSPERSQSNASRSIIEKIAREGRKFHASLCLVSQRPVQLSTTALSQCNTHIILRITNPYDLDHIKKSSEGITQETVDTVSSLRVGEALIVGEAVSYPLFVKIRKRKATDSGKGMDLERIARLYEEKVGKIQDKL